MTEVITIGLDLAKNVFQVHGVDVAGAVAVRRQLRRGQMLPFFEKQPPCLVSLEGWAHPKNTGYLTDGWSIMPRRNVGGCKTALEPKLSRIPYR